MDQTYTASNTFYTTPTADDVKALNIKIDKMQTEMTTKDDYIQSVDRRYSRAINQIDSFRQSLMNAVKNNEIDINLANYFASCFDFDIRREFNFTGTLKFEGVVYLPLDVDPDDLCLDDYVQFDFNSYRDIDIELSTYNTFIDDLEEV